MSTKRHNQEDGENNIEKSCDTENEIALASPSKNKIAKFKLSDPQKLEENSGTLSGHSILSPEFSKNIDIISQLYTGKSHGDKEIHVKLKDLGTTVHAVPFKCCELKDFIQSSSFLNGLKSDLQQLNFSPKNNDLYKFHQSGDLKKSKTKSIRQLREILYTEFRDWLKKLTGIPLDDTVDMSCSIYKSTDTLLCHDDQLEGRRVAFIFYLVPEWTEEDGGTLDLFNIDDNGDPGEVVKYIYPEWNKLVFFEVSPQSFHQVGEVMCEEKIRLAVSGWFHGPTITQTTPKVESQLPLEPCLTVEEEIFYKWLNPVYLDITIQVEIQEKFETESEIELRDFINPEMYKNLVETLRTTEECGWVKKGPANKRSYYQLKDSLSIVRECMMLFQSDAFFLVLSNLTGLALHELAGDKDADQVGDTEKQEDRINPAQESGSQNNSLAQSGSTARCYGEVRWWKPGCYTLVSDTDIEENAEFALDLRFFIDSSGWLSDYGGFTSYIAKDEDEELLTVNPSSNCLALVYRDTDTLQFVKHINHKATEREQPDFYDIHFVYYE